VFVPQFGFHKLACSYDAREHLDENAQTIHGPLTVDSPGLSIYTIEHYACKLS